MKLRLLVFVYTLLAFNGGQIGAQGQPDYITSLLPKLTPLTVGFRHTFTSEDPKGGYTSTDANFLRYYLSYESIVGYIKVGNVICLINTYPGDDIYLIIKTYIDGVQIGKALLCFGTSGAAGCELDSNKEDVKLVGAYRFENTRILQTTDCDENDNKIKGTTKTEKSRRTITIKTDGTISVTETTE